MTNREAKKDGQGLNLVLQPLFHNISNTQVHSALPALLLPSPPLISIPLPVSSPVLTILNPDPPPPLLNPPRSPSLRSPTPTAPPPPPPPPPPPTPPPPLSLTPPTSPLKYTSACTVLLYASGVHEYLFLAPGFAPAASKARMAFSCP